MIVYIQILLIALLIAFPIMYHVYKARIEFSFGFAFMLGVSCDLIEIDIHNKKFEKYLVTFSFGPVNVTGTWLVKVPEHA